MVFYVDGTLPHCMTIIIDSEFPIFKQRNPMLTARVASGKGLNTPTEEEKNVNFSQHIDADIEQSQSCHSFILATLKSSNGYLRRKKPLIIPSCSSDFIFNPIKVVTVFYLMLSPTPKPWSSNTHR